MNHNRHPFTTATFEDGSIAVVRRDPRQPRLLEVIAIFFDAGPARDYADQENAQSVELAPEPKASAAQEGPEPTAAETDLSARQSAVLKALRTRADKHGHVAAKAATLAQAARIPLGSLHSILQALERKQLIKTVRGGSARSPTVYKV